MTKRVENALWVEVGESMRQLRRANGVSLRQLEEQSRWRRGTLSQAETGKARPTPDLIGFYDRRFGGDGLLVSMYIAAKTVHPFNDLIPYGWVDGVLDGDALSVTALDATHGVLVRPGQLVTMDWKITNTGTVRWRSRVLHRIGATAGAGLIASAPQSPLLDADPGQCVQVSIELRAPAREGTVVAYWRVAHAGAYCFAPRELLSVSLVVA